MKMFFIKSSRLRTCSSWAPRNLLFEMQREFITRGLKYLKGVTVPNNGDPVVIELEYPPHLSPDGIHAALRDHEWGADFEPDWRNIDYHSRGEEWLRVRLELVLTHGGVNKLEKLSNTEAGK